MPTWPVTIARINEVLPSGIVSTAADKPRPFNRSGGWTLHPHRTDRVRERRMCGLCGAACLFSRGGNGRPAGVDRYSDLDGREAAQGASMTPRKFNKPEAPPANSVRMDAARLNRFLDERDAATEQGDN